MTRFVVRFVKDVLGDNGCEREICQSSMEIDAADKLAAAESAKGNFCRAQHIPDWSLHADRIQVLNAESPF
jgi:hypothetical protein